MPTKLKTSATRYAAVWWLLASNAVQETFVNRGSNIIFLTGKAIRLGMTLLFLFLFKQNVSEFGGYSIDQVYVFFITYTLIDQITQTVFRGVYFFTTQIRRGDLDFVLTKPLSPLFLSLVGKPDINDALFLIPTVVVCGLIMSRLDLVFTPQNTMLFLALFLNGLLIATAFHIVALIVGVVTTDTDGIMWMYRDLSRLATFPVTIYQQPLQFILFLLIPIGVMVTVPAQALLGSSLSVTVLVSFGIGIGSLLLSLWGWKRALRTYTSASS